MDRKIINDVKAVIRTSVNTNLALSEITDDLQLAGNVLDSMAVSNLILALENYFGFMFDDADLTAEAFETVLSLSELVASKLNRTYA